ncbi:MAG TPA: bacillithiol transferase BstA [Bryobacteraceae bacterium]|nr:bacillithiol transferase BstA [Bryobacteraceae bacterium]
MNATSVDLRYPIRRYEAPETITADQRNAWITELSNLPRDLKEAISGLSDAQLDTAYRPGGWSVRQVVHHLPDSHINCYVRFRLALTEPSPLIKPYEEAAWAELADAKTAPAAPSLALLDALHARWVFLLETLGDEDFARTFRHPELGDIKLDWTLGLYAWHSRHHLAQITGLRERSGW